MTRLPCGHPEIKPGPCPLCRHEGAVRAAGLAPPGLAQKALNLARAAIRHAAAGLPRVDEATYRARLAACAACEMNYGTAEHPKCRHPDCGCRMTVKCWWAEQKCPHPGGSRWELPVRQGANP